MTGPSSEEMTSTKGMERVLSKNDPTVIDDLKNEMDITVERLSHDLRLHWESVSNTNSLLIPFLEAAARRITSESRLQGEEVMKEGEPNGEREETKFLPDSKEEPKIEDADRNVFPSEFAALGGHLLEAVTRMKSSEMNTIRNMNALAGIAEDARNCQAVLAEQVADTKAILELQNHALNQYKWPDQRRPKDIWSDGGIPATIVSHLRTIPESVVRTALSQWVASIEGQDGTSPPIAHLHSALSSSVRSNEDGERPSDFERKIVESLVLAMEGPSINPQATPKGMIPSSLLDFIFVHLRSAIASEHADVQSKLTEVASTFEEAERKSSQITLLRSQLEDLRNMWMKVKEAVSGFKKETHDLGLISPDDFVNE